VGCSAEVGPKAKPSGRGSLGELSPRPPLETSAHTSDQSSYNTYQSGGNLSDPSAVPAAYSNDPESSAYASGSGGGGEGAYLSSNGTSGEADRANAWESRFGWRIDVMAAVSYLGGPITGTSGFYLRNPVRRAPAHLSSALPHPRDAERLRPVPRYVARAVHGRPR